METNSQANLFLNALVSNMDIGVISYDTEGYITLINEKATEFFGIEEKTSKLINSKVVNLFDIPVLKKKVLYGINKTRKEFHLADVMYNDRHLIIDGKKLLDGMFLSITDITENVLAKDEATQSLLLGQEMERRRLAKEIHDGVGPNMSAIKLQVDAIKRKATSEIIVAGLEDINESISSIATDIRQISHDLMPSSLIDYGVITALSNFAKKISNSSEIDVHFQSNISDSKFNKEYDLNIYRIVQELVNNAIKHSECDNIEISIRQEKESIDILVQDDGKGMEETDYEEGIGLYNIQTRVESLQGTFYIDSPINIGVTVHISLPILDVEE